jgi:hypothetical protein
MVALTGESAVLCNDTMIPTCALPLGNFVRWYGSMALDLYLTIWAQCRHPGDDPESSEELLVLKTVQGLTSDGGPWAQSLLASMYRDAALPLWLRESVLLGLAKLDDGSILGTLLNEEERESMRREIARLLGTRPFPKAALAIRRARTRASPTLRPLLLRAEYVRVHPNECSREGTFVGECSDRETDYADAVIERASAQCPEYMQCQRFPARHHSYCPDPRPPAKEWISPFQSRSPF